MSDFHLKTVDTMSAEERARCISSKLWRQYRNHYLRNIYSEEYYGNYLGDGICERSYVLFHKYKPVMMLPSLSAEGQINYAGEPSLVLSILDGDAHRQAISSFFEQLKKSCSTGSIKALLSHDAAVIKECFANITAIDNVQTGIVDLSLSEEVLHQTIRKSYKSLVNWGRKSLEIKLINADNIDPHVFKEFKDLHFDASGRKTRSDLSWNHQYGIIQNGFGYLTAGYHDGRMVSGCYIMHDDNTALYGVAASDRNLMSENKPLTHFPLFQSILTAKKKGCYTFNLGDVANSAEPKANNIAKFKRGFATNVEITPNITMVFSE